MEIIAPIPRSPEFHFNTTAADPSSPQHMFGEPFNHHHHHYTSAPTSPTRAADIYSRFSLDFSFNSCELTEISTADELFEKGRIRPLHPPPPPAERGRKRSSFSATFENRARESRSLSPLRDHSYFIKNTTFTAGAVAPCCGGSRKWRLKDLLLFRSSSEGRATDRGSRDPLGKYSLLFSLITSKKKGEEDSRNGSFRSTESCGGSMRRGGGQPDSAHKIHYTAKRAAAEEQRKKTPLPYQMQGFFGCLQFNPAIRSITKGFSGYSSSRGRS